MSDVPRSPAPAEESGAASYYRAVFILSALYLLFFLLNYRLHWMNPEVPWKYIPNALENGTAWSFDDFFRGFDSWKFDECSRARFISHIFMIANFKFRSWLWNHLPPHPSLSLNWLLLLFLTPVFFYKLLRNLSGSAAAGWAGLSLFLLSFGFLGGVSMVFHPGKPLTIFFTVFCMYLASRLDRTVRRQKSLPGRMIILYIILLLAMLLAFFTDETGWFIFICVPVLFPSMFLIPRGRTVIIITYASTVIFYLLFVTYGVPPITRHFGFGFFDFWDYAAISDSVGPNFRLINALNHGYYFLTARLSPLSPGSRLNFYIAGVFLAYAAWVVYLLPARRKKLFFRALAVLSLFLLFHTIIHIRWLITVKVANYYGSLFSVFFALAFSTIFTARRGPVRAINRIVLPLILIISAGNFQRQTTNDIREQYGFNWIKNKFPRESALMRGDRLTYALARDAWKNRDDKDALAEIKARSPFSALWLFRELEYVPVRAKGTGQPPAESGTANLQ